jgi:hypothetical protein
MKENWKEISIYQQMDRITTTCPNKKLRMGM